MPLVRITMVRGRAAAEKAAIGRAVHEALVETAGVPADDRFQVLHEVAPEELVFDRGYLGFERTPALVIVQVFLNVGRTTEVKKALYAAIAGKLGSAAALRPDDVLVNLVEVPRENWSFGGGVMSYPPGP
jgi:phenylpyruvate tautomerase PptA (4-oxalocrotonate tautomerase family)